LRSKPTWLITHLATHAGRLLGEAFDAGEWRRYHYALLAALEEFGPQPGGAGTLTDAGIDRLHRLGATLDGVQDALLAPLSQHKRAELTDLLSRVLDHHATSRRDGASSGPGRSAG
jgi:hypothetical protein